MNENNNLEQPQKLGQPNVLETPQNSEEVVTVTQQPQAAVANGLGNLQSGAINNTSSSDELNTNTANQNIDTQVNQVQSLESPMPQSTISQSVSQSTSEPVATPIPGTENVSSMPNNIGGGIGQEPISLGTINNNGFVEPTKIEDIGAVPPQQEKPKRPMNKVLFVIIIIALIAAVAFGVYYYLNMSSSKANVTTKDITIGIGDTLSDNINDYATITGGGASSCTLNTMNVNTNSLGDYNFTIICGEDSYSGTVHVIDKSAPTAQLKVAYKVLNNDTISIDDFVVSCEDDSDCTYNFTNEDVVRGYLATSGGPYNVAITIKDSSNNSKEVNSLLYVAPYDITSITSCSSKQTAIEGYDGTVVSTDNLLLGRNGTELVYMGLSTRTYAYTFKNQEDYITAIGDKPEDITFNNVSGIASYDDANYTLTITTDLSLNTLNAEAGGIFNTTYAGVYSYYNNLGYTCVNNTDY